MSSSLFHQCKNKKVNILVFCGLGDNWFASKTLLLPSEHRETNYILKHSKFLCQPHGATTQQQNWLQIMPSFPLRAIFLCSQVSAKYIPHSHMTSISFASDSQLIQVHEKMAAQGFFSFLCVASTTWSHGGSLWSTHFGNICKGIHSYTLGPCWSLCATCLQQANRPQRTSQTLAQSHRIC